MRYGLRTTDADPGKIVVLTAAHVLERIVNPPADLVGKRIGQPTLYECDDCCTDIFATVLRRVEAIDGLPPKLDADAGIAELLPGRLEWIPQVAAPRDSVINQGPAFVHGTANVTAADKGTLLHKFGRTTAIVKDVGITIQICVDGNLLFLLRNQITVEVPPGVEADRVWACGGDSGSVALNSREEVVGILATSNRDHTGGSISPIEIILPKLQIEILTQRDADTPQKVSGLLQPVGVPPGVFVAALNGRLPAQAARAGRQLATLYLRHADEVRTLIATNPRVGALWTRADLPGLFGQLTAVGTDPDRPPPWVGDEALAWRLDQLASLLSRHGSDRLRIDVAALRPDLDRMLRDGW